MFSYFYNYFLFLFNPELLVMVCCFLFLFFAIIQEKGQLGSYLQELEGIRRAAIERHLAVRENMIRELEIYLERSVERMRKIMMSYEMASRDSLVTLQHIIKKLSNTYIVLQVKYFLNSVEIRTQYLSLQIRLYLTHDLFVNKSYNLLRVQSGPSFASRLKVL